MRWVHFGCAVFSMSTWLVGCGDSDAASSAPSGTGGASSVTTGAGAACELIAQEMSYSSKPTVSVNAAGAVLALWLHPPSNDDHVGPAVAALRGDAGWAPPEPLSTTVIAQDLNGVLAANGSAVAAYVDPTLTPGHLWAHRWDGFWSAPVELGPSTDSTHPPAVTIDSTGHAWAAWAEAGSALLLSDSTPDAAWSTPTRLVESPGSGLLGTVSIAANDAGHILLGYSDSSVDLDGPHVFALLGDGSVWAPPVDLGIAINAFTHAYLDASGDAMLAWRNGQQVWVSTYDAVAAEWSPVVEFQSSAINAFTGGVNARGDRVIAWGSDATFEGPGDGCSVRRRAAGSNTWEELDVPEAYYRPGCKVAIDGLGTVWAVYYDEMNGMLAKSAPIEGDFGEATDLCIVVLGDFDVAANEDGRVVVLATDGVNNKVEAVILAE